MALTAQKKYKYAESKRIRPRYNGLVMVHLLLLYQSHFLEIEETWVDKLLNTEAHQKGEDNMCSLAYLF